MSFDARLVDPRVRLAMRLLEFEQTAVPSLDELATRVGLSPFHLSRLFTEQVGESCARYGRRIRLDNSNHQMIHDDVSLDGVAATFGYASQAAFTRAYTRQFGMPPRQYVAAVLGKTQADFAQSHLGPVVETATERLLGDRVHLREHASRPALARRFYGHDIASHWQRFLCDLPDGLADGTLLAGMSYDNVRVTPARHWRYDCAIVFDGAWFRPQAIAGSSGLDPVEAPGGLHAETAVMGGLGELWRSTIGLLTEWLPSRREYVPEGDPIVHWLTGSPSRGDFAGTATIRIRPRGAPPAYNLPPLTRAGRPAGKRTDPAAVLD